MRAIGAFVALGALAACAGPAAGPGRPRSADPAAADAGDDTSASPGDDTGAPVEPASCPRFVAPPPAASTLHRDSLVPRQLGTLYRTGRCLAVDDLDGDDRLDVLTIVRAERESATPMVTTWWGDGERTEVALPGLPGPNNACTLADLDRDGDLDLVAGDGAQVLRVDNLGDRTWGEPRALVTFDEPQDWLDLVAVVDLDGEGHRDLLVATGVRLEDACVSAESDPGGGGDVTIPAPHGDGRVRCFVAGDDGFQPAGPDVCPEALTALDAPQVLAAHAADLDGDARPELYLAADFSENLLLASGPGGLVDASAGSGVTAYDHAMGTGLADFDGDGLRDLYVADLGPDGLYLAADCLAFYDAALARGTATATDRTVSWGTVTRDFDLDGDADVFTTVSVHVGPGGFTEPLCEIAARGYEPPSPMLHVGEADATFSHLVLRAPGGTPNGDWYTIVAAAGDLDADGDMDVVTSSERGGVHVWENRAARAGSWLGVRPLEGGHIAVGSRIVVRHPGGGERVEDLYGTFGTGGHSALRAHFGLGEEAGPVTVDVRWPDGTWSTFPEIAVDQHVDLTRDAASR